MNWLNFLLDHYTQRLKEETRPEAKQFLRTTLNQLKHATTDRNNDSTVRTIYVLESSVINQQTKNFLPKI